MSEVTVRQSVRETNKNTSTPRYRSCCAWPWRVRCACGGRQHNNDNNTTTNTTKKKNPLLLFPLLLLYAKPRLRSLQQCRVRDTFPVFTQRWRPSSCHRVSSSSSSSNTPMQLKYLPTFSAQTGRKYSCCFL